MLSLERIVHALWGFDPSYTVSQAERFEGAEVGAGGGGGKGSGKSQNRDKDKEGEERERESPFGFETYRPFTAGGKVLWTPVRILREGGLLRLAGRYKEGERWGWLVTRAPPEGAPIVSKAKGRKGKQDMQRNENQEKMETRAEGEKEKSEKGEMTVGEVKEGNGERGKTAKRADPKGVVRGVEMRVPRNERTLTDDVTEEFVEALARASGDEGVKQGEMRSEDSTATVAAADEGEMEDASERTKFRMLYDCRFLITFDFSKTPSHLQDILSSLLHHQQNPSSPSSTTSSSPRIIIEPTSRYYWPQVILRQPREPDIILATIRDKIAQLAELNERKRKKGVNMSYGIWKQNRLASAVEKAMGRLLAGRERKAEDGEKEVFMKESEDEDDGHRDGDGEEGMKAGREGRETRSEWVKIEFIRTLHAE